MQARSVVEAGGSPQRRKYETVNEVGSGRETGPILPVTSGASLLENALAGLQIGRAVGSVEGGWLVRLALGRASSRVLVSQEAQVGNHGEHLRAILGQWPAAHAARHASVDAILDGLVPAAARRNPRVAAEGRDHAQIAWLDARSDMARGA